MYEEGLLQQQLPNGRLGGSGVRALLLMQHRGERNEP